jgi:hypothetical protein
MSDTPGSVEGDLVEALIELRSSITPLVEELVGGRQPSVERWLAFADLISNIIPLVRRKALVPGKPTTARRECSD